MRRLREVFTLTTAEQRVILFAFAALVLFVAVKTYRARAADWAPFTEARDQRSPSPGIRP
jgi:hypothetical protein